MMSRVRVINLLDVGLSDYMDMDALQRQLHREVINGGPDSLLVFQASPTYTAGRHTKDEDIKDSDLPVIAVDRAGSVTWHGPGQVVVYPVVKLKEPVDLIAWIRAVEAGVIHTIHQHWGLDVTRIEGRAGVWLRDEGRPDRKICAIGLKVAQGATLHGVALNVNIDPADAFTGIVPCGLVDADVASLNWEGIHTNVHEAASALVHGIFHSIRPQLARPDQQLEFRNHP